MKKIYLSAATSAHAGGGSANKKIMRSLMLLLGIMPIIQRGALHAQEVFMSDTQIRAEQQKMSACGCETNWSADDPQPPPAEITWGEFSYTVQPGYGSSTTAINYGSPTFKAYREGNVWRLRITGFTIGPNCVIRTGGSRDPDVNPPLDAAEANEAISSMRQYYTFATRGSWHTVGASVAHERYHYEEQAKPTINYYWPAARSCIDNITAPLSEYPDAASAKDGMVASHNPNQYINALKNKVWAYIRDLGDGPEDRPYAVGQRVLNQAILRVRQLAQNNGWAITSDSRVSTRNPYPACYLPYSSFNPCP